MPHGKRRVCGLFLTHIVSGWTHIVPYKYTDSRGFLAISWWVRMERWLLKTLSVDLSPLVSTERKRKK